MRAQTTSTQQAKNGNNKKLKASMPLAKKRVRTRVASRKSQEWIPQVKDLMTPRPVTLSGDDSVRALRDLFDWKQIRHVPITGDDGQLVGLMSHRDYLTIAVSKLAHLQKWEQDAIYDSMKIRDVMGKKVVSVSPDAPLAAAAEILSKKKFGCLPVVKDRKLVGIITESDFVKAFLTWSAKFRSNPA
ncbi:MAG: CBS domain-containing protein [Bdellovibrionota bacterium]